jgi:hypothetical protein
MKETGFLRNYFRSVFWRCHRSATKQVHGHQTWHYGRAEDKEGIRSRRAGPALRASQQCGRARGQGAADTVQVISYDDDYTVDGGAAAEKAISGQETYHCQFPSPPIMGTIAVAEPNKVLRSLWRD